MTEKGLDDREQSYGGKRNGNKARCRVRTGKEGGKVEEAYLILSRSFCITFLVL